MAVANGNGNGRNGRLAQWAYGVAGGVIIASIVALARFTQTTSVAATEIAASIREERRVTELTIQFLSTRVGALERRNELLEQRFRDLEREIR